MTTADVLAVLVPHWATKRETMRKLRREIGAIMRWAVAQGFREDNPAGESLGAALAKASQRRQHQRALPYEEVAGALVKVHESDAWSATKLAFEFVTLTATRSGEVRGARWSEVDLAAQMWVVPADRMKSGREHRVPLSGRAIAILEAAKALSDGDPDSLIFPSMAGRMLSDSTLSKLVRELGIPPTRAELARDIGLTQPSIDHQLAQISLKGWAVTTPHVQRGIVLAREGEPLVDAGTALGARNIVIGTSVPSMTRLDFESRNLPPLCRAAVHYLNTEEEVARLADAVAAL